MLYILLNNLDLFKLRPELIENIKFFTSENKMIFEKILGELKIKDNLILNDLEIDTQLTDKIFKFASIKHILYNNNDEQKVLELFEEIKRDLKNYELEYRIEELESKFSKDLSESTFNEIRELKKLQNIN